MKGKYFSRLTLRFSIFCALFTALLCVLLSVFSYLSYRNDMYNRYREYGSALIGVSAAELDGDDIRNSIRAGEMSETLRAGLERMNRAKESSEVRFMYVVYFPEDDPESIRYVMYANTDAERAEGVADSKINAPCAADYTESCKEAFFLAQNGRSGERAYVINPYQDEILGHTTLMTVFQTINDAGGEPVCVIGADIPMTLIREHQRDYIRNMIFFGSGMLCLFLLGFLYFVSRQIIAPVLKLEDSARDFIRQTKESGDDPRALTFQAVAVPGNTEIRDLSIELLNMTGQLKEYMIDLKSAVAEKERIGAELDVAAHIQASMLPNHFPAFPERDEFTVFASMTPAKEVGGDFYDFFLLDERHLAVVMADVSGKGVPASLFMVIGKTLIKDHTQMGKDLGAVFSDVNNLLFAANGEHLFITAFEGVLDLADGTFRYVNAGHELPYFCRQEEAYVQFQTSPGFVLAGLQNVTYQQGETRMEPGDRLFLYTDGVPEATDAENCLYGFERLGRALNRNRNKHPSELLPLIQEDVDAFVGDAPQFDDLTMLCLEFRKKMEGSPEEV